MKYVYFRNELYHHGILGQKWGVRRYQNTDGSYKSGAEGQYDPGTDDSSNSSASNKKTSKFQQFKNRLKDVKRYKRDTIGLSKMLKDYKQVKGNETFEAAQAGLNRNDKKAVKKHKSESDYYGFLGDVARVSYQRYMNKYGKMPLSVALRNNKNIKDIEYDIKNKYDHEKIYDIIANN